MPRPRRAAGRNRGLSRSTRYCGKLSSKVRIPKLELLLFATEVHSPAVYTMPTGDTAIVRNRTVSASWDEYIPKVENYVRERANRV